MLKKMKVAGLNFTENKEIKGKKEEDFKKFGQTIPPAS